jgi:alpha-tubulin suppressor-like RCC1 family protein
LALDSAGQVWGAGDNSLGQLGCGQQQPQDLQEAAHTQDQDQAGASEQAALPAVSAVAASDSAVAMPCLVQLPGPASCIAAGAEHSAAVLKCDGSVWTWGWGEHGQLGSGSTADRCVPMQVLRPMHAVAQLSSEDSFLDNRQSPEDNSSHPRSIDFLTAAGVACGSGFTVAWGM